MEIKGKIAAVTGSGSGIGKAIAVALAREGADLVLADIRDERITEVAEEIRKLGRRAITVVTDVSKLESVENLYCRTLSEMGGVDILINNAGVHLSGPFHKTTLDDWKWMMDINVWSVIYGVHVFLPHFLERGSGHIVNTASIAGQVGVLDANIPYTTSKFAVVGLSESLALYLNKKGIGVTVICPGVVQTNIGKDGRRLKAEDGLDEAREKLYSSMSKNQPPRNFQVISPEDVGNQVIAAIKDNVFLVITHEEDKKNIQKRAQDIQRLINRRADVLAQREEMVGKLLQSMK